MGKLDGDHSFGTCAKFSKELTFLTPDMHMYMCVLGGVRNVSFSESFAYILNEWPHENLEDSD